MRKAGGRVTPARATILFVLLASKQPLSHRDVEQALAAQGDGFDRVTLYRTLDWLQSVGLAHKVAGEDRTWRFRGFAASGAHEHAHFACRACGALRCLDNVPQPRTPHGPRGYKVERAELTLRGLCPDCRA